MIIPPYFFCINCDSGGFHEKDIEVFAEKLLKLDGGAVALIAATESSWRWRNDSLMKGLFDALWPGLISVIPQTNRCCPIRQNRLGDALNYAKAYILIKHGTDARSKEQLELYHVIGDPTLKLWTAEPFSPELHVGLKGDVLYLEMNTCPRDAILTIWYRGELLGRVTPSATKLAIPLSGLTGRYFNAGGPGKPGYSHLSIFLVAPGCPLVEKHIWV